MARKTDAFPKREERVPYSGKTDGSTERQRTGKKKTRKKSSASRRPNRKKTKISPKQAGIGIVILVLIVVGFALFHKNGAEVFVGENSMGILTDTSITPEQIVQNLEAQLATEVGTNVKINEEITVQRLHISSDRKKDVCTMEYMLPKLKSAITYKVEASVIFVDGGAVAPLATQAEAEEVLQQVKDTYYPSQDTTTDTTNTAADTANTTNTTNESNTEGTTTEGSTTEGTTTDTTTEGTTTTSNAEISFVENVNIQKQFVNSAEILSVDEAFAKLTSTTPVTTTYTIQSKDTLAKIAAEFDMTLEEVIAANPGMTITTPIVVGQTINVTEQKPMVSVKSVETQVLTMVEKKTYETQYDDTKPASYQRVIQQGRDGQKKSTIQITRVNGLVTEEKEVSKEVIQEPVTEIIVKGTQ